MKLSNVKFSLGVGVTATCITVSYELKDYLLSLNDKEPFLTLFIIVISLIIGGFVPSVIINFIIRYRVIRQLINGKNSIEGFWLFECASKDVSSILAKNAVGEVSFDSNTQNLAVSFYRKDESSTIGLYTSSNNIIFEESTGRYVNNFIYDDGKNLREAMASGKFFKGPGSKKLNLYNGILFDSDRSVTIMQKGKRIQIDPKTLKENDWVSKILDNA